MTQRVILSIRSEWAYKGSFIQETTGDDKADLIAALTNYDPDGSPVRVFRTDKDYASIEDVINAYNKDSTNFLNNEERIVGELAYVNYSHRK